MADYSVLRTTVRRYSEPPAPFKERPLAIVDVRRTGNVMVNWKGGWAVAAHALSDSAAPSRRTARRSGFNEDIAAWDIRACLRCSRAATATRLHRL